MLQAIVQIRAYSQSGAGLLLTNKSHSLARHPMTAATCITVIRIAETMASIGPFATIHRAVVDVNYLDRSATTILAGGSGE